MLCICFCTSSIQTSFHLGKLPRKFMTISFAMSLLHMICIEKRFPSFPPFIGNGAGVDPVGRLVAHGPQTVKVSFQNHLH